MSRDKGLQRQLIACISQRAKCKKTVEIFLFLDLAFASLVVTLKGGAINLCSCIKRNVKPTP